MEYTASDKILVLGEGGVVGDETSDKALPGLTTAGSEQQLVSAGDMKSYLRAMRKAEARDPAVNEIINTADRTSNVAHFEGNPKQYAFLTQPVEAPPLSTTVQGLRSRLRNCHCKPRFNERKSNLQVYLASEGWLCYSPGRHR